MVIGIESANRDRTEIENVVGCFVNTLALRADLSGNPSFVEALRRVRKATLGATSNRELPFDRLVQDLQPPRDRSRTPVFQVMFSMNNTPAHPLEVDGFRIEQFLTRNAASKFDLAIEAQEGGMGPHHPAAADQIIGTFSYRSTLFRHATIERMVARLERMAAEVIARPDTPIGSISLMDDEERARLLFDWNATDADHGPEGCLHDLLDAQARARPDRVAVETSSAAVTYGALAARVNALAAHLRREGVGPETVVALFSGPSVDALVGILGVLKAGGAYLPIDPAQPAGRVAWMLEDSRPLAVLTTEALRPRLPAHGPRSILLDEPAAATEATPAVDSIARPEHLAYVIYTSGSTGKPKRVLVPHRCAVNTVRAQASIVGVTAGSRVAQFASLGFDASVWETFMALAAGATLCILGRREDGTVDDLGAALDALRVDTATLPPTVLAALEPHALPALTTVVVAGERLPAALAARWAAGRRLVNAYGPTEAAICATMHEIDSGAEGDPPIGRPIENVRIHVLDPSGEPAPVGLPGEIYIGGAGVARGYGSQAALTARQFVPDPFARTPGARLYRTGDRGRWRDDGTLEFLGRVDRQVKLRGVRVELGEVEAALALHPDVAAVAAVVSEGRPGDPRLVAYVEPRAGASLDAAALQRHAKGVLPSSMVPSAIVLLAALPRTASDKLDRRALPDPDAAAAPAYVAPRTATETAVAREFGVLLGAERVGAEADFFALGGHSLLAPRLIARLRAELAVELPLTLLFEAPTVAELSARVNAALRERPAASSQLLLALARGGAGRPLYLVHPVGGGVMCYAELARRLGARRPVYALAASGLEPGEHPCADLHAMAARYADAIEAVQPTGPYLLGGWSLGGVVAFEVARLLHDRGRGTSRLVLIDSQAPGSTTRMRLSEAARFTRFLHDMRGEPVEPGAAAGSARGDRRRGAARMAHRARARRPTVARGHGRRGRRPALCGLQRPRRGHRRVSPGAVPGARDALLRAGSVPRRAAAARGRGLAAAGRRGPHGRTAAGRSPLESSPRRLSTPSRRRSSAPSPTPPSRRPRWPRRRRRAPVRARARARLSGCRAM